MGLCLQQFKGGYLHPVAYGSNKLTQPEIKISTIEREVISMSVGTLK